MDKFKDRYKKLNEEQKKAVDTVEGPVLVIAGPGSGKTEILGLRVVNILRKMDVLPGNVLCLTFTDSAAVNMRNRLTDLIGPDAYKVAIHTFHSFGRNVRNYHPEVFYSRDIFAPADQMTQMAVLEDIFEKLDYDNPLAKTHSRRGYIYKWETKKDIEYLKKAGLTPDEFRAVLDHNKESLKFLSPLMEEIFGQRVSKALFEKIPKVLEKIESYNSDEFPVEHMKPLVPTVHASLGTALTRAVEEDSTKPLTNWQNDWTYKKKNKKRALKADKYVEKMYALAEIYEKYMDEMESRGYYDFDDMILDVVRAVDENQELKYDLQEQFQYILVDEFQDTNDAQMRLLHLLTDAEVLEGRPNIMAVGDDDQAIFKFQGAKVSNVFKFREHYRDPEVITMVKNYRSRQEILDTARYVINQGEERLENIIPDIEKKLESKRDDLGENDGEVTSKSFPSAMHEYHWVAREIERLIEEEGKEPEEIAVIARVHKNLKALVPFLAKRKVPVSYERQRDVFQEPHIKQLIRMSRFVLSILDTETEEADHLMAEILTYPFWDLDREIIWEISRQAYKERKTWLECMKEHENTRVQEIADFFLELAVSARHEPLEKILDEMVGARMHALPDSEDMDETPEESGQEEFISPFKDYYFGEEKFKENPVDYLTFLSSLRTFVYALREYKQGEMIGLSDLIEFVETHKNNNMSLPDKSSFVSARNAVHLLTAHKAKGQEFDTVFVLNCQDDIWAGRKRGSILPFPANLPIAPAGDTRDDQLRLFYVALTRAERNLYLNSYELDEVGKEKARLQFIAPPGENPDDLDTDVDSALSPDDPPKDMADPEVEKNIITSSWESYHHPPFHGDEEVLLETVLDDYKLNATHLNNFLDVASGGPQKFLEDNLLRFPQPKAAPLSFGTAMHATLHRTYNHLKKQGGMPDKEEVLGWLEELLFHQRLSESDFDRYLQKGKDALSVYYDERKDSFSPEHLSEFNFSGEGVVVDGVPMTGKIDKLEVGEEEIVVYDFKTGSALEEWDKGRDYEKRKSHNYKNQLIFYKLLVENSSRFGGDYEVNKGVVEFLEPEDGDVVTLELDIKPAEVERVKKLVGKVYEMIMSLNFPDVDEYDESIKGIKEFENDILESNI